MAIIMALTSVCLVVLISVLILASGVVCKGINKYLFVFCMMIVTACGCFRFVVRKTKEEISKEKCLFCRLFSTIKRSLVETGRMFIVYPGVLAEGIEEFSKVPFRTREKDVESIRTKKIIEDMVASFATA